MEKPSLQIGIGNWAIKEDELLGYSTAGTRFVPQPITMTRASAGTRVNSSGLVETVELLGSELVEDSNFPTPNTEWGTTLGWSIADNKASNDGTGGILRQTNTVPLNTKFKVVFTVSDYVTGDVQIKFAPVQQSVTITGNGTYTIYTDGGNSTNGDLQILAVNSFQGSITNISVKEVTKNNLARVDYDGTASSLLVEPERTNLIQYSEDFSGSGWFNTGTTVSIAESITDPSGNNNSYKLIESSGTGFHFTNTYTSTLSSANTFSFYAKSSERTQVSAFFSQSGNVGAIFDLSAETATASGTGNTATIENVGNGWYRCVVSNNGSSQISNNIRIGVQNGALDSYTGDGTSGVYIWGTQTEQGSYATSYIPTDGSTVTRVQDQYSKTGISNLINSEEGVLFVESKALADDEDTRISISDGTGNNYISIGYSRFSGNIIAEIFAGGVLQTVGWGANGVNKLIYHKFALSWGSGTMNFYMDGNISNTESVTSPTGMNVLKFSTSVGANNMFGKVKQLQVYDIALTPTQLQALTS